jgi:hypothetical protein
MRAMLDPKRDLVGATPEKLARALLRPLRPRAGGQAVVPRHTSKVDTGYILTQQYPYGIPEVGEDNNMLLSLGGEGAMGELKPNGHALAMAEAFQGMIHDAVNPIIDRMDGLEDRISKNVQGQIEGLRSDVHKQLENHQDTINQKVKAQLAQHRRDISAYFAKSPQPSR